VAHITVISLTECWPHLVLTPHYETCWTETGLRPWLHMFGDKVSKQIPSTQRLASGCEAWCSKFPMTILTASDNFTIRLYYTLDHSCYRTAAARPGLISDRVEQIGSVWKLCVSVFFSNAISHFSYFSLVNFLLLSQFRPRLGSGCESSGSVVQTLDVIRELHGDAFAAHEVPLDAMMESLGKTWLNRIEKWNRSVRSVFY